jgi:hypothetical protein
MSRKKRRDRAWAKTPRLTQAQVVAFWDRVLEQAKAHQEALRCRYVQEGSGDECLD